MRTRFMVKRGSWIVTTVTAWTRGAIVASVCSAATIAVAQAPTEEGKAPPPSSKPSTPAPAAAEEPAQTGQTPKAEKPAAPESATKPTKDTEALGVGGHCLVSYFDKQEAITGDAKHERVYGGVRYRFASEANRKKFESDPEKYLPRLGGWCAMALGGPYENRIASDSKVFLIHDGKLYLFSSERAKRAYEENPAGVLENAETLFAVPFLRGYCPVSYQTAKRPVMGDAKYAAAFQGRLYHLASDEARKAFLRDPARYVPRFDAYCAWGLSASRREPADLTVFSVFQDRTYFFVDSNAKAAFDANPELIIPRAENFWKVISER